MKKDNVNSERRAKSKKQELLAIDEQIMSDGSDDATCPIVKFVIQQMMICEWSVMAVASGLTSNVPKLKVDVFLSVIMHITLLCLY